MIIRHHGSLGPLPDFKIRELARKGMITPFAQGKKRPGKVSYGLSHFGYDFRLGTSFSKAWKIGGVLSPKRACNSSESFVEEFLDLDPGESVLAETVEAFEIPDNVIAMIYGKSSYARLGLLLNSTPFEPGWKGKITLHLTNLSQNRIRLHVGEGIGQMVFFHSQCTPEENYRTKKGKYQDAETVGYSKVD